MTIAAALILMRSGRGAKTGGDAMLAMLSVGAMAAGYLMMNLKPSSSNVSGDVCTTLRISGVFLTRIDENDGKRYFACMMGNPGGCACCAPGGVIEFEPKSSYKWPTSFPPIESRITVSGRLKMVAMEDGGRIYSVPCLFEADISH